MDQPVDLRLALVKCCDSPLCVLGEGAGPQFPSLAAVVADQTCKASTSSASTERPVGLDAQQQPDCNKAGGKDNLY